MPQTGNDLFYVSVGFTMQSTRSVTLAETAGDNSDGLAFSVSNVPATATVAVQLTVAVDLTPNLPLPDALLIRLDNLQLGLTATRNVGATTGSIGFAQANFSYIALNLDAQASLAQTDTDSAGPALRSISQIQGVNVASLLAQTVTQSSLALTAQASVAISSNGREWHRRHHQRSAGRDGAGDQLSRWVGAGLSGPGHAQPDPERATGCGHGADQRRPVGAAGPADTAHRQDVGGRADLRRQFRHCHRGAAHHIAGSGDHSTARRRCWPALQAVMGDSNVAIDYSGSSHELNFQLTLGETFGAVAANITDNLTSTNQALALLTDLGRVRMAGVSTPAVAQHQRHGAGADLVRRDAGRPRRRHHHRGRGAPHHRRIAGRVGRAFRAEASPAARPTRAASR